MKNKMGFSPWLAVIAGCMFLLGCLSGGASAPGTPSGGGAPAWYTDVNQTYPNQAYLAVRGRGRNERQAKRDAAGELAALFTAKIKFDSTATFRYSESGENSRTSRSVDQSVRIRSDQEISGMEYSEPFRGGGSVYIVAYLDRKKAGKLYSERIEDRRDEIAELRRRAQKLSAGDSSTKNLLEGFILYDYSVDQALRNRMLLEQLQIINKSMHERIVGKIDYNSVQLAEERNKFAGRLSFAVNYSGDEDLTFLGENIADQMTKLGFSRSRDEATALVLDIELVLTDVETNNRYKNLAWDLQLSFTQNENADGSGPQKTLLEFSRSGRESGVSISRTVTTLKRLLNERIEKEFLSEVFAYFSKFTGI
ncbi:LPP20 family lipoprotein [Candidatus Haliotispira prima]|uniref:LPP20 family lipoprotein n=1 Tax=Candidatus Haliotispira prima TaxID=3034016 RepID=A0ABY8MGA0_9SPIO|nr:LPP20 family lipoprotein [Candidatus Haliotispira prima]